SGACGAIQEHVARQSPVRWFYLAIGWLAAATGAIGFVLPVLPSTVFFLIALWAFSRGSPRFESWLFNHRLFGPTLQAWRRHRVISVKAKSMALVCMATSLLIIIFLVAESWPLPLAVGVILALVAGFILRCPSRAPGEPR
ncbi:MAG TPA: YbaN family protein, partial [Alphaproteobacteria bacterium]|nr:YbaN family protein [Alphaproteobacteria bacterium]